MKCLLLLALLSLAQLAAVGQSSPIDSLKRVIETTQVDTVRGRTLCRLCDESRIAEKHEEGLAAGERGLEMSLAHRDRLGEALCRNYLGNLLLIRSSYAAALQHLTASLSLFEELNLQEEVSDVLGNIGSVYFHRGNYSQALDYNLRSLKIKERNGLSKETAPTLNNIGNIYVELTDYKKAISYYQRCLEIEMESRDSLNAAISLLNMGSAYLQLKDYPKAVDYIQQCFQITEKLGHRAGMAGCLFFFGEIDEAQGNLSRALERYEQCLQVFEEVGDQMAVVSTLSNISNNYLKQNKAREARSYARRCLTLSKQLGDLQSCASSAQFLYQADSALGNWKSAFEALLQHKMYSDSLKNDEQSREVGRLESKAEYDKQAEIDRLKAEEEKRRERERFTWVLGSAGGGLLLLFIIAYTLFRGHRKEKRANVALRALNEQIGQQKAEIEAMNAELQITLYEVNEQKQKIESQHEKIEDSIRYASRIQHAILPSIAQLQEQLPPHFIHYQPRDIVSGDFYWMTRHKGRTFLAAVDCTGHGVPGAFMSVLGSNLLHQIVDENLITEPDVILSELDRRIAATLRQQFGGDSKDGMDVALIVLHEADASGNRVVEYAGAGRPFWQWRDGQFTEYKSAKYACGGSQHEAKEYPAQRIEARPGDRLYLFSDGVTDQFGGPQGRKLGAARLQAFLAETAALPIEDQGLRFREFFSGWMEGKKQLDDVLLAGVAV